MTNGLNRVNNPDPYQDALNALQLNGAAAAIIDKESQMPVGELWGGEVEETILAARAAVEDAVAKQQ